MKFKSIQFSVVALAGASVLAVVAALVLYALFAGGRTQTLVQERTQALLEKVINERLVALARAQASQIQRELEYPLTVVKGLAQANMLALIAVLLTLPLLLAGQFTLLPLWITVPYLSLLAVIIFREYVRRMHYAGILPGMNWIAGINLASMTSFVLYLFT